MQSRFTQQRIITKTFIKRIHSAIKLRKWVAGPRLSNVTGRVSFIKFTQKKAPTFSIQYKQYKNFSLSDIKLLERLRGKQSLFFNLFHHAQRYAHHRF